MCKSLRYTFCCRCCGASLAFRLKGQRADDVTASLERVVDGNATLARVTQAAVEVALTVLAHDDAGGEGTIDQFVSLDRKVGVATTGTDDSLQLCLLRVGV